MTDVSATVKIHLKKGTTSAAPQGNHSWKQAYELKAGATAPNWTPGDWTTKSAWWYYFTGMNQGGHMNGGVRENGRLQYPGDKLTFTVQGMNANDTVEQIVVVDAATPSKYDVTQPSSTNSNVATVVETPHTDPADQDDHFHVWGHGKDANNSVPTVYCDPIIRNRN